MTDSGVSSPATRVCHLLAWDSLPFILPENCIFSTKEAMLAKLGFH
jgi:hypothetical protein